jgi:hypothetical protein
MKFGRLVICPKCGQNGFATVRNVRSNYTSKRSKIAKAIEASLYTLKISTKSKKQNKTIRIDQSEYWSNGIIRGQAKNDAYIKEIRDKGNSSYKVYTKTYNHLYIGHYNRNEYELKKIEYDHASLNARPNGRKWCYVPKNSVIRVPSTADNAGFTINYKDLKKILQS